jgi:hypothetical protein
VVVSSKNLVEVGIKRECWAAIGKCSDCFGGIRPYARKCYQEFARGWEYPTVFTSDYVCSFEEIASAGVVAEPLVEWEEFLVTCPGELLNSRELLEYAIIKSDHSICLRLLKENLGEPNTISTIFYTQMIELSPGELVTTMECMPVEEGSKFKWGKHGESVAELD